MHKISDIFFNIWARIIMLVSTYRVLGPRNSINMLKLTKGTSVTKQRTKWRTKQGHGNNVREMHLLVAELRNPYTIELQWLAQLWYHENMFETGEVRANEC